MRKLKILAEISIPYLKGVAEKLGEVTYLPSSEFTHETVKKFDWLIVRSITKCTAELLKGTAVKLITTATIGYDHIDTEFCEENGIAWFNAPGCNADSVGQYFGAVLSTLALEGKFIPKGKTLGIVGAGNTGKAVEKYARSFGMNIILNDPPREEKEGNALFLPLSHLAEEADMITFHVPLTQKGKYPTYHLCNNDFIKQTKRKPFIANFCRGAVTETSALVKAYQDGLISGLLMDCWEGEPNIAKDLLEKVLLGTPHIAGFSADGKANATRMCLEKGILFFNINTEWSPQEPPAPNNPLIDLNLWENDDLRIHRTILETLRPRLVDQTLRQEYERFESLRREYPHPREPKGYVVKGGTAKEREALQSIGFRVLNPLD